MPQYYKNEIDEGPTRSQKSCASKARREDGYVNEEAFDQILRLERTYVENKLRKFETSLDKRLHEMSSRVRAEIANELLQQVLVCENSVCKKLRSHEKAGEIQIKEACDQMLQDVSGEVCRQISCKFAEHEKALVNTSSQMQELQRCVQDWFESQQHSCAQSEAQVKALTQNVDDMGSILAQSQIAEKLTEQESLIARSQGQLVRCDLNMRELKESVVDQGSMIGKMRKQIERLRSFIKATNSDDSSRHNDESMLADVATLPDGVDGNVNTTLRAGLQEMQDQLGKHKQDIEHILNEVYALKQVPKHQHCVPHTDHLELESGSDTIQGLLGHLRNEWMQVQEEQAKQSEMDHARMQIDINALQVELFAESSRRASLGQVIDELRCNMNTVVTDEEKAAHWSPTVACSLFSQFEEQDVRQLSPKDVSSEALAMRSCAQCFDISDTTTIDIPPEQALALHATVEAIQGDFNRLDQELVSERLDRDKIHASISGLECEFNKFTDEISNRIEKLETRVQHGCEAAKYQTDGLRVIAATEKVVEVSTISTSETVALEKVVLNLRPMDTPETKASKSADMSRPVMDPLVASSPSRRARLGRQCHQSKMRSSPAKTPPRSVAGSKDEAEPDEITHFLRDIGCD
jgi:hypothetical protein